MYIKLRKVFVHTSLNHLVHFPDIPHSIVDELSSDQNYAYRICMAVMVGSVDEDLHFSEVGPIVYS